jgi:hypothetical protein
MKRILCLSALAFGLLGAMTPQRNAQAQSLIIGRGGVQYNGYGQGYYGGYGQGYRGYGQNDADWYSPRMPAYSGYGNGPYGYAPERVRQYPSRGDYDYRYGTYNDGYVRSGRYERHYAPVPVYRPYGFGIYIR